MVRVSRRVEKSHLVFRDPQCTASSGIGNEQSGIPQNLNQENHSITTDRRTRQFETLKISSRRHRSETHDLTDYRRKPTREDDLKREAPTTIGSVRNPLRKSRITGVIGNLTHENWLHSLPFRRFQALLTLFPKSFSSVPHGTFSLSVSDQYLALDENYHPFVLQFQRTRLKDTTPYRPLSPRGRGSHPPWHSFPRELTRQPALVIVRETTIPK